MKKSFNSKHLLQATLVSIIGLTPRMAHAAGDDPPGVNANWEKCYGVSKAGENECSSLDGSHGCHALSQTDNDPNEFIWVQKGACQRIVNGTAAKAKKSSNVKAWCKSK